VSRRTTKLLAAAAAVLALAGCANLRPGVAAEVGDQRISMDEVDQFARGLCTTALLTRSAPDEPPRAPMTAGQTRRAALSFLVRTILANDNADMYLDAIPQSQVDALLASRVDPLVGSLPEDERDEFVANLRAFVVASQLVQNAAVAQVTGTGGELTDPAVTAAITDLWAQWADNAGVEIDPRFGDWADIDGAGESGSLSIASADNEPSTGGPGSATCDG
jgi:hypothetical protein